MSKIEFIIFATMAIVFGFVVYNFSEISSYEEGGVIFLPKENPVYRFNIENEYFVHRANLIVVDYKGGHVERRLKEERSFNKSVKENNNLLLIGLRAEGGQYLDEQIVAFDTDESDLTWSRWGEKVYPDTGLERYGLSYRPSVVPGRPEALWKRVYVKKNVERHEFIIACLPPIGPGSISPPETCGMNLMLDFGGGKDSVLVKVSMAEGKIKDWRIIERFVKEFLKARVSRVTGDKNER